MVRVFFWGMFGLLVLGCGNQSMAHPGGHSVSSGSRSMRLWSQPAKQEHFVGSFHLFKQGHVYIQGGGHRWLVVPIHSLSPSDQRYVQKRVEAIARLNTRRIDGMQRKDEIAGVTSSEGNKNLSLAWVQLALFLFAAGLFGGVFWRHKRSSRAYQSVIVLLCSVGLVLSFVTACGSPENQGNNNANTNDNSNQNSNAIGNANNLNTNTNTGTNSNTNTNNGNTNNTNENSNNATTNSNNNNVTEDPLNPTNIKNAFAPFAPNVQTRSDDKYVYVSSNGLPAHNMMVGITNWQQQVPLPQPYTGSNSWSIPLNPELATEELSIKNNFLRGAIAVAVNGIPIFNPLNNRGEDANLIGELDKWGGHCGRADDYHYHVPPLHLQEKVGNRPIAYALDGFPVYGNKEPDGSAMQPLDKYHGHTVNNQFHYHGTTTYPYMIGIMRGKVSLDPRSRAPENEISPQAKTKETRPALTPLRGAEITGFQANGDSGYTLTYKLNGGEYQIKYSWDSNNSFTFTFVDANGKSKTESYQRR